MMTTTTYGFRAEEERMRAADERADVLLHRRTRVWNALKAITQPALRESAYNTLATEIEDGEFIPGWFQIDCFIVGIADEGGDTIAVHRMTGHEQGLVGPEGFSHAEDEIGVTGDFDSPESIGNALCHARFHEGEFIVNITTAE